MPKFSEASRAKLATCHPDLQRLFNEVVKHFDCRVTDGHRCEEMQELYYAMKRSKVRYPNSKHNSMPSMAVDVIPYPVNWKDKDRFYHFAGFVKGLASQMGLRIRWGGDWDGDTDLHDQTFVDFPHFELEA